MMISTGYAQNPPQSLIQAATFSTYPKLVGDFACFSSTNNALKVHVCRIRGDFGQHRLNSMCLQVQPVTCFVIYNRGQPAVNLLVRDDLTLLDDGGEISKSSGIGWRFDPRSRNLLSTWQKLGIGLSAFYLKKEKKKKPTVTYWWTGWSSSSLQENHQSF